jgi:hypothetical protein
MTKEANGHYLDAHMPPELERIVQPEPDIVCVNCLRLWRPTKEWGMECSLCHSKSGCREAPPPKPRAA